MLLAPPPPPAPPAPIVAERFAIVRASVGPRRVFIGARPVSVRFAFRAAGPTEVRVRIERGGRLIRGCRQVRTGQPLGAVGATGNAVSVGCHLHFELHGPSGPFDPAPRLRLWDGWT